MIKSENGVVAMRGNTTELLKDFVLIVTSMKKTLAKYLKPGKNMQSAMAELCAIGLCYDKAGAAQEIEVDMSELRRQAHDLS